MANDCAFGIFTPMNSQAAPAFLDPEEQERLVREYVTHQVGAGDRLIRALEPQVGLAVRKFLGSESGDQDDIISESLMAVLGHIERRGGFEGNLQVFAVTVARNRCRTLLTWRKRRQHQDVDRDGMQVADKAPSVLELIEAKEVRRHVRLALGRMDEACRILLKEFFLQEKPVEEIRLRLGLDTVQGVYYRKTVCVKKLAAFLNQVFFGSSE